MFDRVGKSLSENTRAILIRDTNSCPFICARTFEMNFIVRAKVDFNKNIMNVKCCTDDCKVGRLFA